MTTWATNAHRLRFMERNHAALAVGSDACRRAVSATFVALSSIERLRGISPERALDPIVRKYFASHTNTVSDGGAAPALNDGCIEQDDLAEIR